MTAASKIVLARVAVAASAALTFVFFAFVVGPGLKKEWDEPKSSPGAPETTTGTNGWLDPAEAPAQKGRDIPPVDPATVMTPRPALLARGKDVYRQNCMSCHGERGAGDGPAASTLNPRPRNFTGRSGWTNGFSIAEIWKTIASGVPGTGMAAFEYLVPADRMAVLHYVRSLGDFDHGTDDPAALANLAAQFRSAGGRVPNHIPVSAAIARLAKEDPTMQPLDAQRAPILAAAVSDPARAARTFAGMADAGRIEIVAPALAAGAPANGFSPAIAKLGPDEWAALYDALARFDGRRR
jgi:mono/diheme cytochrome c family protein